MIGDLTVNAKLALFVFGAGIFVGLLPGLTIAWFTLKRAEARALKLLTSSQVYRKAPPIDFVQSERQPDGCGF
jgi:hypothetical protein